MKRPAASAQPSQSQAALKVRNFLKKHRNHSSGKTALFNIIASSPLWHGIRAEVNKFAGGNGVYSARLLHKPGVYIGKLVERPISALQDSADLCGTIVNATYVCPAAELMAYLSMTSAHQISTGERAELQHMLEFNVDGHEIDAMLDASSKDKEVGSRCT